MSENDAEIAEIQLAEERRARKATEDNLFTLWAKELRHKYITCGFLMPFYQCEGRDSSSFQRIAKRGEFILPHETAGEFFDEGIRGGWVHQEEMWFWDYLVGAQEVILHQPISSLPDGLKIEGTPANQIWDELVNFAGHGLFGEAGGGIIMSPDQLDERKLRAVIPRFGADEGESGYLETYRITGEPLWITLFREYKEREDTEQAIETRPAWFHILNYVIFNVPVNRLPVFLGLFENGQMINIRFLDNILTSKAREFIGKTLLNIPVKLTNQLDDEAFKRERRDADWWLWHNVGHPRFRRKLTYGKISDMVKAPKTTVHSAVNQFERKLKENLNNKSLEGLLRYSQSQGLGVNMTYEALVRKGLAPPRKRKIDGFNKLNKLM